MKPTEILELAESEPVAWLWHNSEQMISAAEKKSRRDEFVKCYTRPLYPYSALIAARQAGRDEQREVDAKICDVYTIVNYPYFCKSHKSGAILCAKAIRNQQPSEGEKA